jgi:hypothetical protein
MSTETLTSVHAGLAPCDLLRSLIATPAILVAKTATVRELMSATRSHDTGVALRYQHGVFAREQAIADRLGELFSDAAQTPAPMKVRRIRGS